MPFLTLFSTPKAFTNPHIAMIQKNAIQSWKQLGKDVKIILVGEDMGVKKAAKELGVQLISEIARNVQGTPLISSIFDAGNSLNASPLLAYINSDIIVLPDFLETARQISVKLEKFLLVGQRWDLDIWKTIPFNQGWQEKLNKEIKEKGRRHPPAGSDYFIYPRGCFQKIPDFAVGRAGWDNWMIFKARWEGWKTIDASEAITIIHQSHDYYHLPEGKAHYRLPESKENGRLAGGKTTVFTLQDANFFVQHHTLKKKSFTLKRFLRAFEVWPLTSLHSTALARFMYCIYHPIKAYRELRNGNTALL